MPRILTYKRTRFYRDRRGVTELPFKIFIIAVLLTITVPLVLVGLNRYTKAQNENRVIQEIGVLENAITLVYYQGENASLVVDVDFPDIVEYVRLGDGLYGDGGSHWRSWAIYYKLEGKGETRVPIGTTNYPISLTNSTKDGGLRIGPGETNIMIRKAYDESIEEFFIMATVL